MSALVVYYTQSGNTKEVAEKIAAELDADILAIRESKPYTGWIGHIRAAYQTLTGKTANIQGTSQGKAAYDIIVLGCPVWMGNIPPPVRTYMLNNRGKFQEYGLFCTEGRSGGSTMFNKQSELIGKPSISTLEITEQQLKENSCKKRIRKFTGVLRNREEELTSNKTVQLSPEGVAETTDFPRAQPA